RFDGVFFVGVSTTGIYCRPVCPARTPRRTRCSFYESPARAEAAGFRACFRCRPELAPGHAEVDAVDRLVATAAARIGEGALNDGSVEDLAAELGVTARHLRRAVEAKLGVTPVALAQTRRLALATQLLPDTARSRTEIAFAAGYGSVRRFNAVFADIMGSAPGRCAASMSRTPRAHPAADSSCDSTIARRTTGTP
ncbi:MAG: Ada metal-binding domain-containing protein, partial [Kofleriaceae bacterium]